MENLGDGVGWLYFISVDCAQGYHQIRVWYMDQEKLAFFAPDGKTYTYTVIPFVPVNAPLFCTAMVCRFQAEWMHLFHLQYNNEPTRVHQSKENMSMTPPFLPKSTIEREYSENLYLPDVIRNDEFLLHDDSKPSEPQPQETYTATTTVRQQVKKSSNVIVSGSRTIIDDILLWANSCSTLILIFECLLQVLMKYRVSLKIGKYKLLSNQFENFGRVILQARNTTAQSKYNLAQ